MCGINGFNWEDKDLIKKMNERIKHRGPDDEGVYTDKEISLGNRRLAIIDLSSSAKQPMSNEDSTIWITHNGEIYNFKEIRKDLEKKGHKFVSDSDTEVIVHGYEEYGMDILEKLNGMFAFAIYDSNRKKLFLVRDRFGIKPLYYYFDGKKFIFSSEIKGILVHNIKKTPNNNMIFDYLVFNLTDHSEETFFENIYRAMSGTYLELDLKTKKFIKKKWYSLENKNLTINAQKIRDYFLKSVSYRLISDVPVGSCLSGGIDSSSIVCTMKNISPDSKIKTFSAVFPGKNIDETEYVNEVIKKTNVISFLTNPTPEILFQDLHDLIKTQEEPFLGTSIYAQYSVMKMAHENGMKVLLDGQGGDEIFGGYPSYINPYFLELFMNFKWKIFISQFIQYFKTYRDLSPILFILSRLGRFFIKNKPKPFCMEKNFFPSYTSPKKSKNSLSQKLIQDLTYSTIPSYLRYEDKNAMRWGVETRLPFLDHEFVEKTIFLPAEYKIRDGMTKYIFREAMKGILPEKIRLRTDKIGFATPMDDWLKSGLFIELAENLIESDSFKERIYWNWKKIKKEFEKYKNNEKNISLDVWKWINLELWLRIFIDEVE